MAEAAYVFLFTLASAGLEPLTPYDFVLKDGFMLIECVQEIVADAVEDLIGQLLFHHIDFEGSYHADPLQASPPNA